MAAQRLRDPIHNLIVFRDDDDLTAWNLISTEEMQRLRRIKQLGVSELVFPSATHSRLAHSIGVFHNARRLLDILKREIDLGRIPGEFNKERARTALFAALLHDIGHGPFSHAFEEARKSLITDIGRLKKHEKFTADLILDVDGEIFKILSESGLNPNEIADMITSDTPEDMYHAIVSSSFDADRLDYLARDRYFTGTGSGAIDIEWLMDNVRVSEIDFSPPDSDDSPESGTLSFCIGYKARDAAEDFLLSRYRLYTNVYFHKTTRGFEQLMSLFFRQCAQSVERKGSISDLGSGHPLVGFFGLNGETLANYRSLDDTVVWGALHSVSSGGDSAMKDTADRILRRVRPRCLDIQHCFPDDAEKQRRLMKKLNNKFRASMNKSVFKDSAKLSLYGEVGADDIRAQKRIMIELPNRELKEITAFSDATIARSSEYRSFDRYFFTDDDEFEFAKTLVDETNQGRGA